jgi:hypothetical protein
MNFLNSIFSKVKGLIIPAEIKIYFQGEAQNKKLKHPLKEDEQICVFLGSDPVKGTVTITPQEGKKIDHDGITCEFVGKMEIEAERSTSDSFLSVVKELEQKGSISASKTYNFDFSNVRKEIESYYGTNAKIRFEFWILF